MKRAARHKTGSVVFDKRRKTWNFLQWVDGRRRSQVIGTRREFPTKGAACRAAGVLMQSPQKPPDRTGTTVRTLISNYQPRRCQSVTARDVPTTYG